MMAEQEMRTIKGIQFDIMSPEMIKGYSVLHVTHPVTYDQNLPSPGGLFDTKMGTINKYVTCETCEQDMDTCVGHFGHIELARPVYHPGFMVDVLKLLRCVCHSCAALLMDKESIYEKNYHWVSSATTSSNKWSVCTKCKPENEEEANEMNDPADDGNDQAGENDLIEGNDPTEGNDQTGENNQTIGRKRTIRPSQTTSRKTTNRKTTGRKSTRKRQVKRGVKQYNYTREATVIFSELMTKKDKPVTNDDIDNGKNNDEKNNEGQNDENEEKTQEEKLAEKNKRKKIVTPRRAYLILERITPEDAEWLGFTKGNRPENFIISVLPVPPPCVRPSVQMDTSRRGEDDLTYKLAEIIRTNNNLKSYIDGEARGGEKGDLWALLQFHVATYLDNDIPKLAKAKHRSGRDINGIKQRLKSKEGRIRSNLMGKRVDFSARDVITPDPNLSINEVGIPESIAMNLTYKVYVTKKNIDWCYTLLRNGPYKYPGANFIVKTINGKREVFDLSITKNPMSLNLRYGDAIVRHVLDGDYVLFNRQPSLHRMSMMAHRLRVLEGDTFRLAVAVTTPYNADFDGKLVAINSRLLCGFLYSPTRENSVRYRILYNII